MPDLHDWITQQVDETERLAHRAAELCGCHLPAPSWSFRDGDEPTDGRILVVDEPHPSLKRKIGRRWNGSYEGLFMAEHIVRHDPEAVLRRCDADRKILARHRLDPDVHFEPACEGCGTYGDVELSNTDNLNECPELLDLAEAHGLTPEILATLDQPVPPPMPERPEPRSDGGFLIPDAIYGNLLRAVQATDTSWVTRSHVRVVDVTPPKSTPRWFTSPGGQAFAVVEPHLSALALYKPDTPEA